MADAAFRTLLSRAMVDYGDIQTRNSHAQRFIELTKITDLHSLVLYNHENFATAVEGLNDQNTRFVKSLQLQISLQPHTGQNADPRVALAVAPITFPGLSCKRLIDMHAFFFFLHHTTTPLQAGLYTDPVAAQWTILWSQVTKLRDTKEGENNELVKLKSVAKDFQGFRDALLLCLGATIGDLGVPMSYVGRSNDDPKPLGTINVATVSEWTMETLCGAVVLSGGGFERDARAAADMMHPLLLGGDVEHLTNEKVLMRNGRKLLSRIHEEVYGPSVSHASINQLKADLRALHYDGRSQRYDFNKHVNRLEDIQNELVGLGEGFTERELVTQFVRSITKADVVKAAVDSTKGTDKRENFKEFIKAIHRYTALAMTQTEVQQMIDKGGKLPTKIYKKLTGPQKKRLYANRGVDFPGKGGKKRNSHRGSLAEANARISQLESQLAEVLAAEKDDDKGESTGPKKGHAGANWSSRKKLKE